MAREFTTSNVKTREMGQAIDKMVNAAKSTRKGHERRWYDNNFFDDGYHFRYVGRQQNKIVDLSDKATIYNPMRAIPKASRQIRGVTNLLVSNDLVPIVYPEKVQKANYSEMVIAQDPETGEEMTEFDVAQELAKDTAKRVGHWIEEEFENQELGEKLAHMILLSLKHGISYLQIWPDAVDEAIRTQVFDAFDIYLLGQYTDIQDVPFIIKTHPKTIAEIKANEEFDEEQLKKINPDNRHASSEIKEAYMQTRYGGRPAADEAATLILKEAFIKEYLNEENEKVIKKQEDGGDIIKTREKGDPVIRHTFSAGGVWLKDEYLDMDKYPFIDFRMEPGPLYQVPMIERFIPSNKSLDMIVSRIERYAHTMGVGVWLKAKGENLEISNKAGGQVVEYESRKPEQMQLSQIPNFFFNYIGLLNSFIEEQGVTTTTLGKIPKGVESGKAIESLKESEFANLVVANRRLKQTVRRIAERFMDIADDFFTTPQTVFLLEKGEPNYFDIIGRNAKKRRDELNIDTPDDVVEVSKEYRVDVEVQSGLGYTREGRKASARQLGDYLVQLGQLGLVPPNVIVKYIENLFEVYQFGAGSEITEDIESFAEQGQMTDEQLEKMKVALAEVIKDTGIRPGPQQQERIDETKLAVAETVKDMQE